LFLKVVLSLGIHVDQTLHVIVSPEKIVFNIKACKLEIPFTIEAGKVQK